MSKRILIPACTSIIIIVAAILTYVFLQSKGDKLQATSPELQPILTQFAEKGRIYTDPAQCVDCHSEQNAAWEGSYHALANAPVSDIDRERLLHKRTDSLDERHMRWQSRKDKIVLSEDGLPEYPVVGTIGLKPLIQYLHLAPDGRIQAHDVAWDVENEEWFSVFEQDDMEPRIPGEWGHWTGQGMNWDANCAYCHMTEYRKNFDPVTNTYDRKWSHMAITCAQCHPGMDVHLSQIRNGNKQFEESLTPVQVMEYCATCHARREQLTPDTFYPGDRFDDHFFLTLADTPGIYHPDGQVIGENYVYGSLAMSKMGHKGITCMDCHDPHTTGHILPFENNALCQRCHGSGLKDAPKIDPLAHSRHKSDSLGNRCVECHMPSTNFMGRDGRRDHSFSHPDPKLTIDLGIPNACTGCHNTQSEQWALDYTNQWYGEDMNADRRTKARLISDLHEGTPGTGPRLRNIIREEENRFWKATLISMMGYAEPDMENFALLQENLSHPDPLVRAAAVRTGGLDSLTPELQAALLNDPVRVVRINASLASSSLTVANETFEQELEEYLRHTADSPIGSLRYAAYWESRGDMLRADHNIRQAVSFEQTNPEAWRLAAIQLHRIGNSSEATIYLNKALQLSPSNPQVLFNLGLLAYEEGNSDTALVNLDKAVRADPSFVDAWYNLIVLYWSIDQKPTARTRLLEALKNNPDSPRLQQLSVSLQSSE